ncbi:MAG: glycosyltransferase [Acidimicrobiales bacterium]
MRVAVWTPLPPVAGEVARNAPFLLELLAHDAEVVAVTRDDLAGSAEVPDRVGVIAASDYRPDGVDIDVYRMGNDAAAHGFAHGAALQRPGILLLEDPALLDFYLRLGGGAEGTVFCAEVAHNRVVAPGPDGAGGAGDEAELDPLELLMSRRLVEASLLCVVHSAWAAEELSRRSPRASVVCAPPTVRLDPSVQAREGAGATVFGAVGGHEDRSWLACLVEVFREIQREFAGTRLVLGAADDARADATVADLVRDSGLDGAATAVGRLSAGGGLPGVLRRCDVLVDLTWPTAGRMREAVVAALASGRTVIASDSPQYRELSARSCWLVPTNPPWEMGALAATMRRAAADPEELRESGRAAAELVRPTLQPDFLAANYAELLESGAARRQTAGSGAPGIVVRPRAAVNAIGSWAATTGLAEAGRRCVGAILDAGVEVAVEDFDYGAPRDPQRFPARLRSLPRGRPHDVDLWFLNVNEFTVVPEEYLHPLARPRRIVAYWHWEQVSIPPAFREQLDRVDEIWVASSFVAETFRRHTTKPIAIVPCVVEPVANTAASRGDFGLPEDRCLFFFHFDVSSTLARKNPRGVIEAYRRAFTPAERAARVHLVMKTINLGRYPEAGAALRSAVDLVGGTVIDADLRPEDVNALTALCDVYVSLHRAEGFGMGLAEAMYFGKPVIGTAYSGNMDFMTVSNSCPIGYRMAQIDSGELRFNRQTEKVYRPGEWWADPDIDEAARRMRQLFASEALRRRLGQAAARTIREKCASGPLGEQMRLLLERGGVPAQLGRRPEGGPTRIPPEPPLVRV